MNPSPTPDPSAERGATTGRRRHRALVEVDRDAQIDELVRLAAGAEIGLTVFEPDDGTHLDFVDVVHVHEREDGVYVFAWSGDAERFAAAVDHDCDGEESRRAFVNETPVNLGAAAERLIAAERADVLEEVFGPGLAEDVREGLPPEVALRRLRDGGEGGSDAAALLRQWIDLDRRTAGADPAPADAARPTDPPGRPAERIYTVVGRRGTHGEPYVAAVRTSDGPEVALDLAHEAFAEDSPQRGDVEFEIAAIFHGEPELVDFDSPEPGGAGEVRRDDGLHRPGPAA